MNLNINSAALALDPGQLVTLDDACGTQIRMQDGSAWITEEGEQSRPRQDECRPRFASQMEGTAGL